MNLELTAYKSMVRPLFSATVCTSNFDTVSFTLPCNYVVKGVPVFGSWMAPCPFVHVLLLEDAVGDSQIKFAAE